MGLISIVFILMYLLGKGSEDIETLYLFGQKGTVKAGGKSVNIIEEWNFEKE